MLKKLSGADVEGKTGVGRSRVGAGLEQKQGRAEEGRKQEEGRSRVGADRSTTCIKSI